MSDFRMTTTLLIQGLRLQARHGVTPAEREHPQWFRIDLEAEVDCTEAMQTDDLSGTVSYADLYALLRREMDQPSCLLEHVAARILQALRRDYPSLGRIRLRLLKEAPPVEGRCCEGCGLEIEEMKNEE